MIINILAAIGAACLIAGPAMMALSALAAYDRRRVTVRRLRRAWEER